MESLLQFFNRLREQRDRCIEASSHYLPEEPIEYLLLGESPPISTYFYIPKKVRKKSPSLPAKVFRAFLKVSGRIDQAEYEQILLELKKKTFFLIDLCTFPLDPFTPEYRRQTIKSEFDSFGERYSTLNLSQGVKKLLVLPSGTRRLLEERKDGFFGELLRFIGIGEDLVCGWSDLEQKIERYWLE